jgi:leucyl-tRNA synthetase
VADSQAALNDVQAYDGRGELDGALADLHRKTHQTIKKVTEDIGQRFHFNTAIAAVMELVNQVYQVLENTPQEGAFWPVVREAVEAVVLLLSPMVPHVAEELWQELGRTGSATTMAWPAWREESLQTEQQLIVVQINGKLRSRITLPVEASKEQLESTALDDPRIQDFIAGKKIKKVVVVPKKLVNIVV